MIVKVKKKKKKLRKGHENGKNWTFSVCSKLKLIVKFCDEFCATDTFWLLNSKFTFKMLKKPEKKPSERKKLYLKKKKLHK